ncbi:serine hydrolase domain-containing protein [Butyrivibrio sp. YAB3001]|uniref:serine hydrolase domain-containing protein n=1 Tax=Butyrivibrio sp. YAB3001 TaxID=1520812 RepID=UPI0008F66BF8|nr:serine hydrolase [Butyrivibrio sp. YAB3001]SFC73303.1 CubicO group peptidase, beta-lactamase class C family [Butyrivibrio sp. YAB3001]
MYEELIAPSFRGVAYVLRNDEVVLEYAGGCRDYANELPNTIDTKFASASAGKVFVAVGILQLIEKGKLRFEDTIGELIRIDWKDIDPGITVEQLLQHTSGIPDYFDETVMEEYEELWVDYPNYKIRQNDDLLPLFIDKPMMYPKGTKFQYNNTGYVVLAMIIERLTRQPFDEYLRENVFEPCNMSGTGYYELDRLPAKCAVNYVWCNSAEDLRTNIFCVDAKGTGAGGAFITVKDIANFWKGLLEGKLLSTEMTASMLKKHSGECDDPEEGYYGYGVWIIDGNGGEDIPYFQGCDPGVSFISEYNPNKNMISVYVSNYGDNVWKIARDIRNALN